MGTVPKAIPTAVAPSAGSSVPVLASPQLGPYEPMSGSSYVPYVPGNEEKDPEQAYQPAYGSAYADQGAPRESGSPGAPSVPLEGFLFRRRPADPHYLSEYQGATDPYAKVNNPPTRGVFNWVKSYVNGIFLGKQDVDNAGWQVRQAQQRQSVMRVVQNRAAGYAPETAVPHQLPQSDATYKYNPVTGNDQPGPGILNRTTFGAGQTAGGIGGSQYTPSPGPPDTTAAAQPNPSGMPSWG